MEEGVGEFMFDMISNYMIKIKSKKINNQEKKLEWIKSFLEHVL